MIAVCAHVLSSITAAQAVDKEQEPEWRVSERKEHLHLVHIPPRVGDEEKARWVVEEDRGM